MAARRPHDRKRRHDRKCQRAPRRGSILLAVLVLIAVMTIGGLAYFNWTNTERRASAAFTRQSQAWAAAESGAEFLRVYLAEDRSVLQQSGGVYDNPERFRGVIVQDSDAAALRVRVSMLSPSLDGFGAYDGYRFGLEDESGRINLNTILLADQYADGASRDLLLGLPGMTDSIADAILDWIDEDDEPREFGAERSYYSTLPQPYSPANGPLESIDQLLLVRDVTEGLLYGIDRDRNLVVDAQEAAIPLPADVDNRDGAMNRGWSAYLTLFSAERNVNADGDPRIDVNQEDLETLHDEVSRVLSREAANFIVAFRQGGAENSGNSPAGDQNGPDTTQSNVTQPGDVRIDFDVPGNESITSLLQLIGSQASTTQVGDDRRVTIDSPFSDEPSEMIGYLPDLIGNLTLTGDPVILGRVNVNVAPRAVLEGLPGMPPEAIELILGSRTFDVDSAQPGRRYGTWLLSEGLVDLGTMRQLDPFVTGGGDVYRAQVVGFFDAGGAAARHEIVVDATSDLPTLARRRDLSPLGVGISIEELGAVVEEPLSPQSQ